MWGFRNGFQAFSIDFFTLIGSLRRRKEFQETWCGLRSDQANHKRSIIAPLDAGRTGLARRGAVGYGGGLTGFADREGAGAQKHEGEHGQGRNPLFVRLLWRICTSKEPLATVW